MLIFWGVYYKIMMMKSRVSGEGGIMNLYKLFFLSFRRNSYSCKMLFLNCAVICFPLIMLINALLYLQHMEEKGYKVGNLSIALYCIGGVTFIVGVMIFQYALKAYIKSKKQEYSLLFTLGIRISDLLYKIVAEYILTTVVINLLTTVLGEILVGAIYVNFIKIPYDFVYSNAIKSFFITLLFFIMLAFISIIFFIIKQVKSGFLFDEGQEKRKSELRYINNCRFICGLVILMISLALLWKYTVGKMLLSLMLNLIGIWLMINTDEEFLKNMVKKSHRLYYNHLLEWNDFIFQCKSNSKVLYSIYLISFISMFLVSGLMESTNTQNMKEEFEQNYPYEVVIYGDGIESDNGLTLEIIHVMCDKEEVIGISSGTLQKLTGEDIQIQQGEIVYISQDTPESFLPLENRQTVLIDNKVEKTKFSVLDSQWKVLFGKSLMNELNNVIVFNNKEFHDMEKNCKIDKMILLKDKDMLSTEKIREFEDNAVVWTKDQLVNAQIGENKIIEILIMSIAIIFAVEQESIVFLKKFINWDQENKEYILLYDLGVKRIKINKLIGNKLKNLIIGPNILAVIMSVIYLICDGAYQGGNVIILICDWGIYAALFLLIQYVGYLITKYEFQRYFWRNI